MRPPKPPKPPAPPSRRRSAKAPKMSFNVKIKGSFVVLLAVFLAFYVRNDRRDPGIRQAAVLGGLLSLESDNPVIDAGVRPRVAVGYGACQDLFIQATDLLRTQSLVGPPQHFDDIENDGQFIKSFAYYFKHGAAAERFMSSSELFSKWVRKAAKLNGARWALGGNAPVMASRFQKEGCDVLLAAKMTDELRKDLHPDIKISDKTSLTKDDIHLILEYATDEIWSGIKTPRANRYIIHNDVTNPTVSTLERFNELLPNFNPDLLIVSGLQMMDNYPFEKGIREARVEAIKQQIINQGKNSRIHFEMASFVEEQLLKDLIVNIIPYCDSIGMNEQELTNLHNLYLFGDITHVVDSNPRVALVLDQMRKLYRIIHKESIEIKSSKQLTRIHVHTLAYQAILTSKNSKWRRSKAAAAKASLTANRHVCGSYNIDVSKSKLILDNSFATSIQPGSDRINVTDDNPVSCWNERLEIDGEIDEVNICVAPVLVCTQVKQTAGCGDNISSAGLVLQI